ncbi:MAG: transcriptional regulator [Acidimicrobiales bacterium]
MDRDLVVRRRAIERVRSEVPTGDPGGSLSPIVSPAVRASWRRCAPTLDSERDSVPVDPADEARERWEASPIRRAVPGLVGELETTATGGDLIALVADSHGRVLWQWTPPWLQISAESVGLMPGGIWNESSAGTNGIGLALASDMPVAVFATEHWLAPLRDWVCYAAPIHAADGTQVGALDLSTKWDHANPLGLTTVAAIARLVEHELQAFERDRSPALGARMLHLGLLGRPHASLGEIPLALSLRQFEILAILALVGTASLDQLHALLYGDRPVTATTLKAEISHLRRTLGGHIASRPYRLSVPCRADAVRLLERLAVGDVDGAGELYAGQLLPASDAPVVVERRHHIDVALRTALLRDGSTAALLRYAEVHPHDVEVLERAVAAAEPSDLLLPAAVARLSAGAQSA